MDLVYGHIKWRDIATPASLGSISFIPFLLMQWSGYIPFTQNIPSSPSPLRFVIELVFYGGICGDFLHYLAHRLLHSNTYLRIHVHSIHHAYRGRLYSWVATHAHPLEIVLNAIVMYAPLVLFAHPYVLWTFAAFSTIHSTCAHSGYGKGGGSMIGIPWTLKPNEHQLHHEDNNTRNYGNVFRIWDVLFGTYNKA